jgi:RNA polymerase-binding protein DksA
MIEMKDSLEGLRQQLLARRQVLLRQVARVEEELRWLDDNVEPEVVEEGQEATMARFLERLDDHDRDEVEAIDRALARMATGDYGWCRICQEQIPLARLQALPATETCVKCAGKR